MPVRMLRDWTDSETVNNLSAHAERFFTRLIMKVDDYGCFYANTSLLKANCYPLLLDAIREADITRWITECEKADLVVLYEAGGKRYLQIVDFKQRLDKAKSKYPLAPPELIKQALERRNGINNQHDESEESNFPEVVNGFPSETEVEKKSNTKRPKGLVVASAEDVSAKLKQEYEELVKTLDGKDKTTIWTSIRDFIRDKKPGFFQPYMDLWNVFAISIKLIEQPQRVTPKRTQKFKTRITESGFDFLKILEKIKVSPFLKGDNQNNWKVSIEFILNSEENYTKILEGKYEH
jgi:hypothetical protein